MQSRRAGPGMGLILLVSLFGFGLIFLGFVYYGTGGGAAQHPPTMSVNDWLLITGVAIELVAVVLFVRRVSVRSRG